MKNSIKRLIALVLTLCMVGTLLPVQILAEESRQLSQGEQPSSLVTPTGEIPVEEDWNEVYPYGTFAFGTHQADVGEPGSKTKDGEEIPQTILIPVYRLGGTVGRVTAKITYAPAVTTQADGEGSVYDYAASGKQDLRIEYENPNPLAVYQELGVPMAERQMTAASATIVVPEVPEDVKSEDELKLTISEPAESYRWQVKQYGSWQDIRDANEAELALSWGDLWNYETGTWSGLDFRCILGNGGVLTCTESIMGEAFEPIPGPPALPEDLEVEEETGYTELVFDEDYAVYRFDLTFADGETVKYIRITARDDELAELPELGLLTIAACEGGQLSDMCNTLTLMVSDNDKGEPSELGFAAEQVSVSRADNTARVKVVRTGGKSYNVTVHYSTVDGTAIAGVDYAKKEGDLAFAGSIDEIEIPIELIATDDDSEKTFELVLTELRGGGTEELCKLSTERITVTIVGESPEKKPDGSGQNLASLLAGGDGEDVSARVGQGSDALIGRSEDAAVTGHSSLPEGETLYATVEIPEQTRQHTVYPHFAFNRDNIQNYDGESSKYWQDWEIVLGGNYTDDAKDTVSYSSKLKAVMVGQATNNNGGDISVNKTMGNWSYTTTGGSQESFNNYCRISANYNSQAILSIEKAGTLFDAMVFATRLNQVGTKKLGIGNTNRYLRPVVEFYATSGNSYDHQSADYEIKGTNDHYYYWFSSRALTPDESYWPSSDYGSDRGNDAWGGREFIKEIELPWGKTATFETNFRMCKQWTDSGDWDETCGNGTRTEVDVLTWSLRRREFETTHYSPNSYDTGNGIKVVAYTANDDNEAGAYTAITGNDLYLSIMPKISIVEGTGGVSGTGNLYVGSKLCIDASNIVGYTIPDNGLFMTNQSGTKVGVVTRNADDSRIWYIEMFWDGMQQSALTDTYQLNIILERTQTLKVDINPSTPRKEADGTIDTTKYDAVWSDFMERNPVIYTASLRKNADGVLQPISANGLTDYFDDNAGITPTAASFTSQNGVYSLANLKNLQAVNFQQDPEDVILYNGRAYAGNDTIPITQADLTQNTMTFFFYDSEYLDAVSPMEVYIDHVMVYYDTDGVGGIGEDDEFIALVQGDYPDTLFKAYKDKDGVVHQYYFRVWLTMRPRAFSIPVGADPNGKAQLLPAFLSAITDPGAAAELTDEQRSYRYILSDHTDNHPMYGAAATTMTYVDIPLGGDVGEKGYYSETVNTLNDDKTKVIDSDTVSYFTWEPEYTGRLLVPFDNPTPIVDNNNITGGSVAIAGETPEMKDDGSYTYTEAGRNKVNANLGSFSGRTTFAIGVQEQVKPTRSTRAEPGINSPDDVKPETIAVGNVSSTPSTEKLLNMQSGGDGGGTSGTGPGSDVGATEFAPDLGTELPSLELELGDYVTIVMDGYEVGFAIGIPVYQYEDTNYSGSEKSQNESDGSKTTIKKDGDGNTIKENVKEENGVKTKSTTTIPAEPDAAGAKQVVTITETTDKDGKTTTKRTVELYYKKDWSDDKEDEKLIFKNTVNERAGEEPTRSEKAKESFKDANGGMATLKEFCKALTSPKKGSMKKFFDGFFEDEGLNNAKNGNTTSQKVQVTFKIQISIMFEYNPIDNCHYFKNAGLAGTLGFEFTIQHRFSFCPLIYVYLKIGVEVELKVSLSVLRNAKEGAAITSFEQGSLEGLSQGQKLVFALDMRDKPVDPEAGKPMGANTARGFHLDLQGKVYMEVFDNKACTGKALASGMLTGDGGTKEVLYEAYDKIVYVRLTPKKNQTVTASNLKPVIGATSKTVFDGLTITPGLSLEVGAGIGIDVLKFEIFIRTSVSISMTMGGYLEETESYEGFYISGFEWTLAAGFHLTILFFNYSMDCIAIGVEGAQHGTGGYFNWDISATAVDGNFTLWEKTTYTAADGKSLPDEPQPPTGFNFFKDNGDCSFFNANGSLTDTSDKPAAGQSWSFSENIRAHRWSGGKFKGEIPMNADLAVANADGAKLRFSTEEDEIWVYFSGTVKISSSDLASETTYKKSPAKLKFQNKGSTHTVDITANKGAKLDRFETPINGNDGGISGNTGLRARAKAQSLVHVSAPTDVSGTLAIHKPGEETRASNPTGTGDFQLSQYNTSGDARKLVDGLTVGYDYKLVQVGNENYLIYPIMPGPGQQPQLVLSRLVMTGNFTETAGLVHPLDESCDTPYLLLDNDGLTDLDYSAAAGDESIRVTWVSYGDANGESFVVKTRTISLQPGAELTTPVSMDSSEDFRWLTAAAGSQDLWAAAEGSGADNNALLKAWILAKNPNLTEENLDALEASDGTEAAAVYTWAALSALNDLHGSGSVLRTANGMEAEIPGESVENLKAYAVGGRTLVLYSTAQTAYFNDSDDGFVTVGVNHLDEITEQTERGVIRRLYLRSLDGSGFGAAKLLQTVIDFEGCTEDNLSAAVLKDGIYENNAIRTAQADPYFANLRFLTARLDSEAETLALFEMGGNTWMLRQADLETVLSGSGAVTLTPIFSETTGTDVCIGSDGDNLAVVYTAPVADSLSNAIFVAWWDTNLNTWGTPVILAMRDLQVYEDRVTYGMSGEDAEKAYLGKLTTGSGYTGSMNRLIFSNLQMSTRTVTGESGTKQQLMILTQGALTALQEKTFVREGKEDYTTVVPVSSTDGGSSTKVAFYAIAFGAGDQALGEARLGLSEYDFTTGKRLIGQVEFTNTGTVAVRASEANPITARLMANFPDNSESQELAAWELTTPIASGAKTVLTFYALPLNRNLPEGTVFSLELSEDASYFQSNAFCEVIDDLLTVEKQPELSISDFDMNFLRVKKNDDGENVAEFDLSLTVGNNGNKAADNVFLQFSYATGEKDDFGNDIYRPIDITGSELVTSLPFTKGTETPAQSGIYQMIDANGNSDLGPNFYRTVAGNTPGKGGLLCVPVSCFVNEGNFSGLHLRVEVYSDDDLELANLHYGVYTSDHHEYNPANNRVEQTFKHQTTFDVPARITTALGTTLTLPVSFLSTSAKPDLVLSEISDGTEGWEPRMGVCYYDADRQVIVAAPNAKAQALLEAGQKPTGILQIKDQSTNSIAAIAYTIGAMADGVNIYKDDASFTFFNADGTPTDVNASMASNPGWRFTTWGDTAGWTCGRVGELPMNCDLSVANQDGAYLSFETVADTMTIYYVGEIWVKSSVFGEEQYFPVSYTEPATNPATTKPAVIVFDNPEGQRHKVTIRASKGTMIDRYVATYKTNTVPETDPDAPVILWSRSFPDTASLLPGSSVPMTCYLIDASGLKSVRFNNRELTEETTPKLVKLDEGLWYFDFTFTKNGDYNVRVFDGAGNNSGGSFRVSWFNDVLSAGAISDAPGLKRGDLSFVDQNGAVVNTGSGIITTAPWLQSVYAPGEDEASSAYLFYDGVMSDAALEKDAGGERWKANWNGVYMVRVDREDGSWARAVAKIKNLDLSTPQDQDPILSVTAGTGSIGITASDDAGLQTLTVNGYGIPVSGTLYSGAFSVDCSGEYTVSLTDSAGNTVTKIVEITVPLTLREDLVAQSFSCANNEQKGSVTVDPTAISGGAFDDSVSSPASNVYRAIYSVALVPEGTAPQGTDFVALGNTAYTFQDLALGNYALYVRDSAGNEAIWDGGIQIAHPEVAWEKPSYQWSDDYSTVTATRCCSLDATHTETETVSTGASISQQPTCTEMGKTTYTAVFANRAFAAQTKTVTNVPALGHDKVNHEAQAPTCTEVGWEAYETCTRCDYSTYNEIPSLGHDKVNHPAQAPTCTEVGWDAYETCTRCDYTTYNEIPALGHDKVNHAAQAPTCTEIGWDAYETCTRCDYTTYNEIPALGHDKVNHEAQAPTCTEVGWDAYETCTRCDYSTYNEIPALGHDLIYHAPRQPSCTEVGWEAYDTCSRCDYTTYNEIPALGHDLVYHEARKPSCTEIGWEAYDTCTRCDYSNYTELPALGHDLIDHEAKTPSCTEIGWDAYENCSRCDYTTYNEIPALGHAWDEGAVTTEPCHQYPGVKTFTCTRCNETRTEDVPRLPNPFKDVKDEDYFFDPVMWALDNGVTAGVDESHYGPDETCARCQIVTFLWRANGSPEPNSTENPFSDVKPEDYFFKAVLWAAESGVTAGMGDGLFGPYCVCTRSQAMTFLWRAKGSPEPETEENPFSDVKPEDYFYTAVLWAVENGVTAGLGDGSFGVADECTRAQIITFLCKAYTQSNE
jgi:hypothetical protein